MLPQDPVEAQLPEPTPTAEGTLLLQCLESDAGDRARRLEVLCREHPEQAAALRALYGLLEEFGLAEDQALPPAAPERVGDYRILARLGQGGMGEVFLAEHQSLGRRVALKRIHHGHGASDKARERFRREALAAARLDHPGICPVFEVGEVDGQPFLAMRRVPGVSLEQTLQDSRAAGRAQARLPRRHGDGDLAAILRLIEDAARALHAAHEQGVVHRDVKPGNLMVTPEGEPVLLDFGLARLLDDADGNLTHTGDELGTPCYMAPEQVAGGVVDHRADIHALGVVLYECLTLRLPFTASNRHDLQAQILRDTAPDPRRTHRAIGRDLWTVLQTALAKEPARRYLTAAAFAEDLRRVREHEPILARRAGTLVRLRRWARRQPVLAVTVVAMVAALALSAWHLVETRRLLRHARAIALTRESEAARATDQMLALLLALKAVDLEATTETLSALHTACAEARERTSFRHEDAVNSVAFAGDGRSLVSASRDRTARVWDLRGKALSPPLPHPAAVRRAVFAPGGEVLTAADDHLARIWRDVGAPLLLAGHRGAVVDVCVAEDGSRVLTASTDGTARLWDLRSGRELRCYPRAPAALVTAVFLRGHSDGVLTVAHDGQARRHLGDQPVSARVLATPEEGLMHAALASDGTEVIAGLYNGTVRVVGLDGRQERVLTDHGGLVHRVLAGPDGSTVLTASADQATRWFDRAGKELIRFQRSGAAVHDLALSSDQRLVATAHEDGAVALWDVDVPELPVLRGHEGIVRHVAWSPQGDFFLTVAESGRVLLWNTTGSLLRSWSVPAPHRILSAALQPDGSGVLTGAWDGTVCALDLHGKELWRLQSGGRVIAMDCASDGSILTANGDVPVVRVWRGDGTRALVRELRHDLDVTHAVFTSDGVLTASHDGLARLFPAQGGDPLLLRHGGRVMSAVQSPDRRWLLTAGSDGTARLWDRAGTQQLVLRHEAGVTHATFSPDSQRILTCSRDQAARVWDLHGRLLWVFHGHRGIVWRASFAPDGRQVLTGSFDHTARLWVTDAAELVALARRRCSRDFTAAERERLAWLLPDGR